MNAKIDTSMGALHEILFAQPVAWGTAYDGVLSKLSERDPAGNPDDINQINETNVFLTLATDIAAEDDLAKRAILRKRLHGLLDEIIDFNVAENGNGVIEDANGKAIED